MTYGFLRKWHRKYEDQPVIQLVRSLNGRNSFKSAHDWAKCGLRLCSVNFLAYPKIGLICSGKLVEIAVYLIF